MGWYESRKGYSTVKDVAIMYGINETTIIDWITKGYLESEINENEKPKYWISDEQLQKFDRDYNEALRLIKRGDRKNNATVVGRKMVEIFNRTPKQATIPIETVNEFKKDICTEDSTDDFVPDDTTYDGFEEETSMDSNVVFILVGIVSHNGRFSNDSDIIGVFKTFNDAVRAAKTNYENFGVDDFDGDRWEWTDENKNTEYSEWHYAPTYSSMRIIKKVIE